MEYIAWGLSVLAALFVGGFLKSYMGRKGENLATKEDFNILLGQLTLQTQATEGIRNDISTKVWIRQLKKDIAFETLRNLANLRSAGLTAVLEFERNADGSHVKSEDVRRQAIAKYSESAQKLQESRILTLVGFNNSYYDMLGDLVHLSIELSSKHDAEIRDMTAIETLGMDIELRCTGIASLFRKDLEAM
jgi:hypothetical protein